MSATDTAAPDEFAVPPATPAPRAAVPPLAEARRQMEICNACRYCEGYCDVFQAMTERRAFADGDLSYLANLCHNCRGCYYACQYADPHEFAINVPRALAAVRQESWADHAWPAAFARAYRDGGTVIALAIAAGTAATIWLAAATGGAEGQGFYAVIPHAAMVWTFGPVFLFALLATGIGVARFWRATGAPPPGTADAARGAHDALRLTNLSGGHGLGCNYEEGERYTDARRRAHHLTLWGFLLCFASTSAGTVLHYGFDSPAPYGLFSLPKLLGIPGGLLLCIGTGWLLALKRRADPGLGAPGALGGETAFVLLLFLTGLSGLALYAFGTTALLVGHLGLVLAFFATAPYSKMVHGAYRLAALVRRARERRG